MEKKMFDNSVSFHETTITKNETIHLRPNKFYLIYIETEDTDGALSIKPEDIKVKLGPKNLQVFHTFDSASFMDFSVTQPAKIYAAEYNNISISFLPKANTLLLDVYSKRFQCYRSGAGNIPDADFDMVRIYFTGLSYTLGNNHQTPERLQQFLATLNIINILVYAKIWQTKNLPVPLLSQSQEGEIVYRYSRLLDEYYKKETSLAFYVDKLNLTSIRELYAATQKIFGYSPKQMMQQKVIAEAQRLLYLTEFPVKHIAYELGFSEPTNFNKFFHKHTGLTPKEFREESKNTSFN